MYYLPFTENTSEILGSLGVLWDILFKVVYDGNDDKIIDDIILSTIFSKSTYQDDHIVRNLRFLMRCKNEVFH